MSIRKHILLPQHLGLQSSDRIRALYRCLVSELTAPVPDISIDQLRHHSGVSGVECLHHAAHDSLVLFGRRGGRGPNAPAAQTESRGSRGEAFQEPAAGRGRIHELRHTDPPVSGARWSSRLARRGERWVRDVGPYDFLHIRGELSNVLWSQTPLDSIWAPAAGLLPTCSFRSENSIREGDRRVRRQRHPAHYAPYPSESRRPRLRQDLIRHDLGARAPEGHCAVFLLHGIRDVANKLAGRGVVLGER